MSRYDSMTPAEILRTMGLAQKELLAALPVRWADAHPSTRDALVTRGLACVVAIHDALWSTPLGDDVLDLIHADVAEDTWEATR